MTVMSETRKHSAQCVKSTVVNVLQLQEPRPCTSGYVQPSDEAPVNIPQVHTTLSLFDLRQGPMEEAESFATMDSCLKEKTTNTVVVEAKIGRSDRTQQVIPIRHEAPPPYDSQPPPDYPVRFNVPTTYHNAPGGRRSEPPGPTPNVYDPFQDIYIRHKFVRKVCTIVALQLLFTLGLVLLVTFHKPTKHFVCTNLIMLIVTSCLWLVLYITLMCYTATRRIFPLNFVLLCLFTACMAYMCSFSSCKFEAKVVLTAIGGTTLICVVVGLLACQTWFDITKWWFILAIAAVVVMIFGIIVMIVTLVTHSPILYLVFCGIIVALFTVFLLYDLQCILGGRRVELSPEEYIYGALTVYVDIVMIFMYMLELVKACF